jgi:RNA polymerase sigma-70 factor (ECF subfamily)
MRLDHRTGEGDALDPQLVLRARDGDPSALAILYECYYDRIHRYILARVANVHEAEDLTEEVFIRMLRARVQFQPRPELSTLGFSAWLFRIAHNLIVDWARAGHAREVPLTGLNDHLADEELERELNRRWEGEVLAEAVGQLTAAQRDVITLRFAAGLSVAETAAVLSKQENTVRVLQHQALAALRRIMDVGSSARPVPATVRADSVWTVVAAPA